MGLFDKFKKKSSALNMHYDDTFQCYIIEIRDIIFVSEDEKDGDYIDQLKIIAENYYNNLEEIVEFMISDLVAEYGDVDVEMVKEKLGRPVIDYDNGIVRYLEQSFDEEHIFEFEFLDDAFKDIQYFSIDG